MDPNADTYTLNEGGNGWEEDEEEERMGREKRRWEGREIDGKGRRIGWEEARTEEEERMGIGGRKRIERKIDQKRKRRGEERRRGGKEKRRNKRRV